MDRPTVHQPAPNHGRVLSTSNASIQPLAVGTTQRVQPNSRTLRQSAPNHGRRAFNQSQLWPEWWKRRVYPFVGDSSSRPRSVETQRLRSLRLCGIYSYQERYQQHHFLLGNKSRRLELHSPSQAPTPPHQPPTPPIVPPTAPPGTGKS